MSNVSVLALVIVALNCLLGNAEADPCNLGSLLIFEGRTLKPLLSPKNCGAALNATSFLLPPVVNFTAASTNDNYTLMLLSTNETNPKHQSLHWLIVGIKPNGTILTAGNSSTLASYIPPTAPMVGAGNFTFMVYRQTSLSPYSTWHNITAIERNNFSPEKWISLQVTVKFQVVAGTAFKIWGKTNATRPGNSPIHNIPGPTRLEPSPRHPSSYGTHETHQVDYVPLPPSKGAHTNNAPVANENHNHKHKNSASREYISGFLLVLVLAFSFP